MVNFDDMTLKELQQLLNVNTKNPNEVKRIQEISGLTGKAVDGIWGKQTSKAWNNFLDKNQSDIEQAINDEQKYQNAIARGQSSPAVEDLVNFSNQLDEQQQARNAKIAQLEQQIAQVKERIVRNERALTGKSYEDANKKLATLEMDKIGVRLNRQPSQSDPTMLWRWNTQRLDTKAANANTKTNAVEQFKNKVNMWKRMPASKTTEGLEQQISNINAAILEGDNIGADVSELYAKMQELQNRLPGGTAAENTAADVDTIIKTANTSDEIASVLNTRTDLTPAQKSRLKIRLDELQKNEVAKAKAAAKKKSRKSIFGD